ncbi:hypothetical protein GCM10023184_46840 [Flaviaesturariibacter amylovorans]|uniref:Glycosyl-hydrolase 97 N-terminal domain-containing protein n=1 Tax=Flaviaesturariibacter amylovorans TaxID=1084520 RepID=A0ABP8HV28_9BACT
MNMKRYLLLLLSCGSLGAAAQSLALHSPDGRLRLAVTLAADGRPDYALSFAGRPVLQPSALGFRLAAPAASLQRFRLLGADSSSHDASWKPVWGEYASIRDQHKELRLRLEGRERNIRVNVVFRLFNEGLGFRYEFPEQEGLNHFIVAEESTQFRLTGDHTAFWIPGDYDSNEYPYHRSTLSAVDAGKGELATEIGLRRIIAPNAVQTPLMLKTGDGLYVNIHEAALVN